MPNSLRKVRKACMEYCRGAEGKEERGHGMDGCWSWHFQSALLKRPDQALRSHTVAKFRQPQDSRFLGITLPGLTRQAKHPQWSLLSRRQLRQSQSRSSSTLCFMPFTVSQYCTYCQYTAIYYLLYSTSCPTFSHHST